MKNKKDEVQELSPGILNHYANAVERVLILRRSGHISLDDAHKRISRIKKDCLIMYYDAVRISDQAHSKLNHIHTSRGEPVPLHLSRRCSDAITSFLSVVKWYREGMSDDVTLKEAGRTARKILQDELVSLVNDVNSTVRNVQKEGAGSTPRMQPDPVLTEKQQEVAKGGYIVIDDMLPTQEEIQAFADMEVKKITKS